MIRSNAVTVEHKRRSAAYASKPGDARRQGRADDLRGAPMLSIEFKESSGSIEARLGVVVVGSVSHDPAAGGYFWAVFLPSMPRVPRPAADVDKAKAAVAHKIREWCESAGLISARRRVSP